VAHRVSRPMILAIVPGDGRYRGRTRRSRASPVVVSRNSAIIPPDNSTQLDEHKGKAGEKCTEIHRASDRKRGEGASPDNRNTRDGTPGQPSVYLSRPDARHHFAPSCGCLANGLERRHYAGAVSGLSRPGSGPSEQERVFEGPVWNFLCLENEIAKSGDWRATIRVRPVPLVIQRGRQGPGSSVSAGARPGPRSAPDAAG
jgi:hypothetical protein